MPGFDGSPSLRAPAKDALARGFLWGAVVALTVATSACHEKHGCCYDVVCPPPPSPMGVIVSPASATVGVGDTARFVVLIAGGYEDPCDEAKSPISRAATWSVSNASVAGIVAMPDSNTVIVRGLAAGTTSVIATPVVDVTAKGAELLIVK